MSGSIPFRGSCAEWAELADACRSHPEMRLAATTAELDALHAALRVGSRSRPRYAQITIMGHPITEVAGWDVIA